MQKNLNNKTTIGSEITGLNNGVAWSSGWNKRVKLEKSLWICDLNNKVILISVWYLSEVLLYWM